MQSQTFKRNIYFYASYFYKTTPHFPIDVTCLHKQYFRITTLATKMSHSYSDHSHSPIYFTSTKVNI